MLDFNQKQKGFCESYLWKSEREYINTFSSLFMSYLGIKGINQKDNSLSDNFLFSCLFVNGIFSGFNHWTKKKGFSYLDGLTMIIPVSYANLIIYEFYLKEISKNDGLKKLYNLLFSSIITVPLVLSEFSKYFNYVFLVLSLMLTGFFYVLNQYRNTLTDQEDLDCIDNINACFGKGVLYVIIGAGCWFVSEPKCQNDKISQETKEKLARLHLHFVWHIFAGYGFYLMIHSFKMIHLFSDDTNKDINRINESLNLFFPTY